MILMKILLKKLLYKIIGLNQLNLLDKFINLLIY